VTTKINNHFAEVIESSLHGWLAQSWQWDTFPQFGSIVTVQTGKRILYGIVHQINTGSMDPMRYPFPYQKTEEELRAEQPQIFEFLKTTFNCLTIGYQEKGKIYYLLAPEPPKIHSFVGHMSREQAHLFFAHQHYLHILFGLSNQITNLDELLLAIVHNLEQHNLLSESKLAMFIETYSLLTGSEYRRLKIFLQRIQATSTI
jgi:hypothetical protein